MANKKVTDLGISSYMEQIQSNKPKAENKKTASLENNEEMKEENTAETVAKGEKAISEVATVVENKDSTTETLLRNAILTSETLFRLEQVKKLKNSTAKKGERISIARLMGTIIEEYLDDNYPQTKELYKLMKNMTSENIING